MDGTDRKKGKKVSAKNILIVEDDPIASLLCERALDGAGYNVLGPATSGETAVELVKNGPDPDLVLMDISLEGDMDGIDASEHIGAVSDVPVIFLTAHSHDRLIERAKATSPYGYLVKPIDGDALLAAVKTTLYRRAMDLKLRKSEEKHRLLYENTLDAIAFHRIVVDEAGRPVDYVFLDVNPAFEKHTGLGASDVLGRKATDIFPDIRETNLIEKFGKVVIDGEPAVFESCFEPAGGHFNISAYRLDNERFAAVFENVTETKQLAERLETTLREKQALIDESYSLVKSNLETIVTMLEAGMKNSGKDNPEAAFLEDISTRVRTMAAVHEMLFHAPEENNIDLDHYLSALSNQILDTYGSENAVGQEFVPDGILTIDTDWRITSFNQAAEEITGFDREDAIGKQCHSIMHTNICEAQCALKHTMQTGESVINKPVHFINALGQRKEIIVSTTLLKDQDRQIVGGVETFRDVSLARELREQYSFEGIIGRNRRMQRLFDTLPQIAESGSNVLIEGETGTGKEVVARALHNLSNRRDGPFIAVNCGALPETLLASELFGHKDGAFTGSKSDKPGRFRLARGGTLFLDEISETSPAMQVQLLRVLQEKTYMPVGGSVPEKADVRIVSASNANLERLVDAGTFRRDLFYRINVVKLTLPSLKQRREDIRLLVEHFIKKYNAMYGRNVISVSNEAMGQLLSYDFPGNVREIENIIEHSFALCRGNIIETRHLPESIKGSNSPENAATAEEIRTLDRMEAFMIERALARNRNNRRATARELGIAPSTLYRKIKKHSLE